MLFDQPYYLEINEARWTAAEKILDALPALETCLDIGCGPGWFAERLVQRGYRVFGAEGRAELTEEASRRVPAAFFATMDLTDLQASKCLPMVDLAFCFGLLYHLENPFATIRTIHRSTRDFALIETQIAPLDGPCFQLISEGRNETQGLTHHAVIPSRAALVKMLYVAGFSQVMRYTGAVDHVDFVDSQDRRHRREIFLASKKAGNYPDFVVEAEPVTPKIDYTISPEQV
jgi:trans-aconitate methyltransferase